MPYQDPKQDNIKREAQKQRVLMVEKVAGGRDKAPEMSGPASLAESRAKWKAKRKKK